MRGCRLRLRAPHESVQALVDRMAHVQHHAIILGDDLADLPPLEEDVDEGSRMEEVD